MKDSHMIPFIVNTSKNVLQSSDNKQQLIETNIQNAGHEFSPDQTSQLTNSRGCLA